MRGCAVGARLEEQCIALRAELVRHLLCGDRVDRRLDLAGRHARIEDEHVRPEVGLTAVRRRGRCGAGTKDEECGDGCDEDQQASAGEACNWHENPPSADEREDSSGNHGFTRTLIDSRSFIAR